MKITDGKPVLNVEQVRALPEFGKLKGQQQKFVLLVSAGAKPLEAVRGAYNCRSKRSGERFLAGLLTRRSMQPILNRLFHNEDNEAAFVERIEELIRDLESGSNGNDSGFFHHGRDIPLTSGGCRPDAWCAAEISDGRVPFWRTPRGRVGHVAETLSGTPLCQKRHAR
jgi:hypothetical protein